MIQNRAEALNEQFIEKVSVEDLPQPSVKLTPAAIGLQDWELTDLFESQVMNRHLDIVSRRLRARNESFYTIGSSGHEGNAVFGKVFRITDMAFLHYRSGALLIQRSKQRPGETPLYDMLLSFAASSEDPIAGGRHKVLGSTSLMVPPQTSTIASHLPKAMGAAHAIGLAKRLQKADATMPHDSVVLCNFGDASANHSTAQGAINAAGWAAYQGSPMPIVFICEDNGIGISVSTPTGWIQHNFSHRAGLHYLYCDGLNLLDTYRAAIAAVKHARQKKQPVFLHSRMIRLMGHAGSDVEISYRSLPEVEAIEANDPLLHSARILIENSILTARQICDLYLSLEQRVARIAEEAIKRPKLKSVAEIMAPLTPQITASPELPAPPSKERRSQLFAQDQRLLTHPQSMARLINLTLADLMLQYPNTVVMGEDVAQKGGVYSVTTGLKDKFGPARVIDTLLDEQTILGLALGLAHNGFLPLPEIQFLAYVHNAEDQIRGEAATLSFFSNGQYCNPMVIRIAALGYQKGFGGHFHNDNSFAVLRDIPGIVIACPSNGHDAVRMLRTAVDYAQRQKRVVIFLEPIALYMTRDLYQPGDGLLLDVYAGPDDDDSMAVGDIHIDGDGEDLCILSYANGYYLSRKVAQQLKTQHSINCRVVDLRWLAPLNTHAILQALAPCKRVLIVDECRPAGSLSEALSTLLAEHHVPVPWARITAEDCFIPIGAAANLVLPSVASITAAALALLGDNDSARNTQGTLPLG